VFFLFLSANLKQALQTGIRSIMIHLTNKVTKRFFFLKRRQEVSLASPAPVSGDKATPPPLIQKYEYGTGKNKVNVRIFIEPTPEPTISES
jgi:hypothetical protein